MPELYYNAVELKSSLLEWCFIRERFMLSQHMILILVFWKIKFFNSSS